MTPEAIGFAFLVLYAITVIWLVQAALTREHTIREQHRVERAQLQADHSHDIERLHAMYEKSMNASTLIAERMLNTAQFGTPTRPEATVVEPEPDAVTRAGRAVDEQTIMFAKERLREMYQGIGVPMEDADLEAEARGLLTQGRFIPAPHIAPLLDPRR